MIIFGQGAIRSHPYIFRELEAIGETDYEASLKKFDRALFGHIGFFIINLMRSTFHALTGSRFVFVSRGPTRRYYQHLTRMSAAFMVMTDIALMSMGGSLKRREKLSGRLGDILSYLYLASAALKRYEDQDKRKADKPLIDWSCQHALHEIQHTFDGLFRNMPYKPFTWLLKFLVFPLGRHFAPPDDKLGRQVAEILLTPSESRDRLTHGLYLPESTDEQLGRIEDALIKVIKVEHIEKRIRKGLGKYQSDYRGLEGMLSIAIQKQIITEEEADMIREAEKARSDVIQVDDLSAELQ
jgi:acyl-CoA dehydrogenase